MARRRGEAPRGPVKDATCQSPKRLRPRRLEMRMGLIRFGVKGGSTGNLVWTLPPPSACVVAVVTKNPEICREAFLHQPVVNRCVILPKLSFRCTVVVRVVHREKGFFCLSTTHTLVAVMGEHLRAIPEVAGFVAANARPAGAIGGFARVATPAKSRREVLILPPLYGNSIACLQPLAPFPARFACRHNSSTF